MKPYYADSSLTVYLGDCRAVIAEMDAASVHCVVTSPPYWGLRDYGVGGQLGLEPTPEEYVANMVGVFREVRRVLRDDGAVWLNLGDCYATGAGSYRNPGSDVKSIEHGGKQAYTRDYARAQPNRMPLVGLKPKDLVGIPWRVAFALQADGWYLRSDIIWAKPNPMPESVTDRPTKSHEYVFLLSKSARYYYDADAVREPSNGRTLHDLIGPGYVALGQTPQTGRRSKKPDGWATHEGAHGSFHRDGREHGEPSTIAVGRNLRSVWTIATQPYPGAHFATFPEKLVEPCVKAGCPPDGVVLDPFAGSGTVGRVANRLGRRAVLIDLSADYIDQAMLRNAQAGLGLGQ